MKFLGTHFFINYLLGIYIELGNKGDNKIALRMVTISKGGSLLKQKLCLSNHCISGTLHCALHIVGCSKKSELIRYESCCRISKSGLKKAW